MTAPAESSGVVVDGRDVRSTTSDPPVDVDRWSLLAEKAATDEGANGELSITFVDDDEMAELNAEHMGQVGPTDVLSFPIDGDDEPGLPGVPRLLGDIVVSPSAAARQYSGHAGTLDDELALLVVHGVLHILGHDHVEPEETERMQAREVELLERHHWQGAAPNGFRLVHD